MEISDDNDVLNLVSGDKLLSRGPPGAAAAAGAGAGDGEDEMPQMD